MEIFTWYDIDVKFQKSRPLWPESWKCVNVYYDEIIIGVETRGFDLDASHEALRKIFGRLFDGNHVMIEFDKNRLPLRFEEDEEQHRKLKLKSPLFRDNYFDDVNTKKENVSKLPGVPILAFHSYKGGVGRTLSLISLIREISSIYGEDKKMLVIDADVEAPGMTWLLGHRNTTISYLDVLSLLHYNEINEELAENIANLVNLSNFSVVTERVETEHFFLPVYQNYEKLMSFLSSPQMILQTQRNKYIISDFFSQIGKILKVDMILIDLRAGFSELSAPFLIDPRVKKYFVTSTSLQSIMGTDMVLNEIFKNKSPDMLNSKILLTMIPPEMEEITKTDIKDTLLQRVESKIDSENSTFLREEYLIEIPFDSSLIHLGDFMNICNVLKGRVISDIMKHEAESMFEYEASMQLSELQIRNFLQKINYIAGEETTAEGTESLNMLSTNSIREIVKNHSQTLPKMVVMGAKGSGKTYIYKQMLAQRNWNNFAKIVDGKYTNKERNVMFFPLLSSVNNKNINPLKNACIDYMNSVFKNVSINKKVVNQNFGKIEDYALQEFNIEKWKEIWIQTIVRSFEADFNTLEEVDLWLQDEAASIVFVIDGLEDLFMDSNIQKNIFWKYALRTLCQNVINELRDLQFGNLGMIVFVRKDMVEDAIEINLEQFKNQYSRYELNWTQTEALRLALWIAAKADENLTQEIDIQKASREVLESKLEILWGKKLGKQDSREASSFRWILAALSDFNGQLQARDIVRFLKYSTENYQDAKLIYLDRYIMPTEIRNAIAPCSGKKLDEIKSEMKSIYAIILKFIQMDDKLKQLPLTLDKISLTGEEISKLESQGYLKISDNKYYFPEFLRQALGFKYEAGARPKVLSLLVQ